MWNSFPLLWPRTSEYPIQNLSSLRTLLYFTICLWFQEDSCNCSKKTRVFCCPSGTNALASSYFLHPLNKNVFSLQCTDSVGDQSFINSDGDFHLHLNCSSALMCHVHLIFLVRLGAALGMLVPLCSNVILLQTGGAQRTIPASYLKVFWSRPAESQKSSSFHPGLFQVTQLISMRFLWLALVNGCLKGWYRESHFSSCGTACHEILIQILSTLIGTKWKN